MKKFTYMLMVAAMFATASCSSKEGDEPSDPVQEVTTPTAFKDGKLCLTDKTRAYADKSNKFALNFFSTAYDITGGKENICLGSYSMYAMLSMVANGDHSTCGKELLNVLGYARNQMDEANEYNCVLMNGLALLDDKTTINFSNSIWYNPLLELKSSFETSMQAYYKGSLINKSPAGEDGKREINKWVGEKTNGVIPDFLKEPLDCDLGVINAMYFKSEWKFPFSDKETEKTDFRNIDGASAQVDMMRQAVSLLYAEQDGSRLVRMPFGNGAFEMVFLLPPENAQLKDYVSTLNADKLDKMIGSARQLLVDISLPKFKVRTDVEGIEYLNRMGANALTLYDMAKDTPMIMTNLKHSAVMDVNENGVEAAAVSMASLAYGMAAVDFTLNRPFLYMIREVSSGTVLFIGQQVKF